MKSLRTMTRECRDVSVTCRMLRQQLNLTQEALGHRLGVSFATINRWEVGRTKPNSAAKVLLEKLLVDNGLRPVPQDMKDQTSLVAWARGYLLVAIGKGEYHYAVEHVIDVAYRNGFEAGKLTKDENASPDRQKDSTSH